MDVGQVCLPRIPGFHITLSEILMMMMMMMLTVIMAIICAVLRIAVIGTVLDCLSSP